MSTKRVYVHFEKPTAGTGALDLSELPEFTLKIVLQPEEPKTFAALQENFLNAFKAKHGATVPGVARLTLSNTKLSNSSSSRHTFDPNANPYQDSSIDNGQDLYLVYDHSASSQVRTCTHNGCGKKYTDEENHAEACQYHPSPPIFHEGLKGWSCCSKRVIGFNEFMEIPGCTYGYHDDTKPPPTPMPSTGSSAPTSAPSQVDSNGVEVYNNTSSTSSAKPTPMKFLIPNEKEKKENGASKEEKPKEIEQDPEGAEIAPGTACKRNGCNAVYRGKESLEEQCVFHPGQAVFHEASKYWSCCKPRTAEFEAFLRIPGCATSKHKFLPFKEDVASENQVKCRYDYYQFGDFAIVNVYAKNVDKELTSVKFSAESVVVHIAFKDGKVFDKTLQLAYPIVPDLSKYEVLSTKVEIKLRKVDVGYQWPSLEVE